VSGRRIKVLVVDDSAVVRRLLSEAIAKEPDLELVGAAPDPYVARDMILAQSPDVITLDIEMPRMDGLTFLTKLMHYRPVPVIVVSSVGQSTCDIAVEAMRRGAVEVMAKPSGPYSLGEIGHALPNKIRAAFGARLRRPGISATSGSTLASGSTGAAGPAPASGQQQATTSAAAPSTPQSPGLVPGRPFPAGSLVAIGASTGGTQAIEEVLVHMPADCPPMVIAQHIPAGFSASFAARLHSICKMEVKEARDGDLIAPGRVLVAPGNFHMLVGRADGVCRAVVRDGPRVHYQRPAVDVLFQSVVEARLSNVVAVLLTGMGSDGAQGLLRLRQAGAWTIAQDEATCVVYGMPKVAAELGAAQQVLPLEKIAAGIYAAVSGRKKEVA
jgi:two-component system, chemotaxis family, protein-glutamate methylesterase/glutaminase